VTAALPDLIEHLTGIPAKTRRPLSLIGYPLIGMTGRSRRVGENVAPDQPVLYGSAGSRQAWAPPRIAADISRCLIGRSCQACDGTAGRAAVFSSGMPACVPLSAARCACTRWARGCPACSRARITAPTARARPQARPSACTLQADALPAPEPRTAKPREDGAVCNLPYQRNRRPRGHQRTNQAVPETMSDIRRKRRRDAQTEQTPRQRRAPAPSFAHSPASP